MGEEDEYRLSSKAKGKNCEFEQETISSLDIIVESLPTETVKKSSLRSSDPSKFREWVFKENVGVADVQPESSECKIVTTRKKGSKKRKDKRKKKSATLT